MSPETEIISAAVKVGNWPTDVLFGEANIRKALQKLDWSDKILIAHNGSGFDFMLTKWRLGISPKMYADTLDMARPIHAKQAGGSLKALVQHYGLGVKDNTALLNTKGRHLKDFTEAEIDAMREYNKADTEQCRQLFDILLKVTPKDEMRLIDMTIRMLVEPQFEVDQNLLRKVLGEEQARKKNDLLRLASLLGHITADEDDAAEFVRSEMASANKFAARLIEWGVEPPMKVSPTTGKDTYALAKTDEAFIALKDHPHPLVSASARARLDVKSTLLETRITAFLAASEAAGGKLPVTLKYYGADTTGRWSGWGYNPQNLPRVSGKPSDCLRNSLCAPKGYKIVVADLSGIELRVNHFLWQVPSSMALYQASPDKADLYKEFASELYQVERAAVSKEQRQVGKVAHLGLGFGAGGATFQKVAKLMAGITLEADEAQSVVSKWREAYSEIVVGWKTCHAALPAIQLGADYQIDPWGLCNTTAEGIKTPKGIIRYPNLRQEVTDEGKTEWCYGEGRHKARIYAGKITENIVQHLARGIIADNALAVRKQTGYLPALTVHDELVYVVPVSEASEMLETVQTVMRTPPAWWPELVTWSEGDIGDNYGQCK
jgi:DNA polymerase